MTKMFIRKHFNLFTCSGVVTDPVQVKETTTALTKDMHYIWRWDHVFAVDACSNQRWFGN